MSKPSSSGWQDGWLVYFDILGFSDRVVKSEQRAELEMLYRKVIAEIDVMLAVSSKSFSRNSGRSLNLKKNVRIFSDSIFIFVPTDAFAPAQTHTPFLAAMLVASFVGSIFLAGQVPCRGAVSHGRCLFDAKDGIFLGEPIVRAVNWEKRQQWLWFSVDPESLLVIVEKLDESERANFVFAEIETDGKPIVSLTMKSLQPNAPDFLERTLAAGLVDAYRSGDPSKIRKWANTAAYFSAFFPMLCKESHWMFMPRKLEGNRVI